MSKLNGEPSNPAHLQQYDRIHNWCDFLASINSHLLAADIVTTHELTGLRHA
jgi:hypothetical protein